MIDLKLPKLRRFILWLIGAPELPHVWESTNVLGLYVCRSCRRRSDDPYVLDDGVFCDASPKLMRKRLD